MQDFGVGVLLSHNIRNRNLHVTSETSDPASHSGHGTDFNLRGKIGCHVGNYSNTCGVTAREVGRGEMVEPEDARDYPGAVVDSEFEEFVGFIVTQSDGAEDFGTGEEERGRTREGGWVRRRVER
ncbi:hypothetical protein Ddye_015874 [Dipteronia dyeriana]|uniref:Uncharacterized protein n=1 Tax=Dipteronia dyeriana TaxID=168575 RepID=A0AAD9U6H6_9ROSI|nr:hypothetical protein Ddye_015874 [Dipteronia dyeriana]